MLYTTVLILFLKDCELFRKIIYDVKHNESFDLVSTTVIEVLQRIFSIHVDILIFLLCELLNPGKFTYPECLHGLLHNLIPGLPYLGKLSYPEIFLILSNLQLVSLHICSESSNN